MAKVGLLCFSYELWTECYCYERVSRQKMGQCKCHYSINFNTTHPSRPSLCWFIFLLQPNTDPQFNQPTVGKVLLQSRGFYTDGYMFWVCVAALIGFSFLFNILFIIALTFSKCKLRPIVFVFLIWIGNSGWCALADLLSVFSFGYFKHYNIGWWSRDIWRYLSPFPWYLFFSFFIIGLIP